jgi:ATP-dependent 26S proteasome regulatory subunit
MSELKNYRDLARLLLRSYQKISLLIPLVERVRVLQWLNSLGKSWELPVLFWNFAEESFAGLGSQPMNVQSVPTQHVDAVQKTIEVLEFFFQSNSQGFYVFENIQSLYQSLDAKEGQQIWSWLVKISKNSANSGKYLVFLDVNGCDFPANLSALIPSVTYTYPSSQEIYQLLEELLPPEQRSEEVLGICRGLSLEEISLGIKLAIHSDNSRESTNLADFLLDYKISQLQKLGLSFLPKPEVTDIGGLGRLKDELVRVQAGFSDVAREYDLPVPKGWLLVGPPGTGKSFAAKVTAKYLGFPLISVGIEQAISMGSAHLKRTLEHIETMAPALIYFDEFDKFFVNNAATGEDSTSKQVLGVFLTWLQEKRSQTFIVATLNRLEVLPPELIREGRFDKIFYVGFPTPRERKEILKLHLSRFDPAYRDGNGRLSESEWKLILSRTYNFTGAELSALAIGAAWLVFFQQNEDRSPKIGTKRDLVIELSHLMEQREKMTSLFARRTDDVLAIENRARAVSEPSSYEDDGLYDDAPSSLWG